MYLNIGMDMAVRKREVIGIFDLDNTSWSKWTRNFLRQAQENGEVIEATDELPKSYILVREFGETKVYLTKYNTAVLQKRLEEG